MFDTTNTPFPSTRISADFVQVMTEEGDANGYNAPAAEHLGFTLIANRLVPETFIQAVQDRLKNFVFDYGSVLSPEFMFDKEFLEMLESDQLAAQLESIELNLLEGEEYTPREIIGDCHWSSFGHDGHREMELGIKHFAANEKSSLIDTLTGTFTRACFRPLGRGFEALLVLLVNCSHYRRRSHAGPVVGPTPNLPGRRAWLESNSMICIEVLKSNVPLRGTSIRAPLVCGQINQYCKGALT